MNTFRKHQVYTGECTSWDERPCDFTTTSVEGTTVHGMLTRWAYGSVTTKVDELSACALRHPNGDEYIIFMMDDGEWVIDAKDVL